MHWWTKALRQRSKIRSVEKEQDWYQHWTLWKAMVYSEETGNHWAGGILPTVSNQPPKKSWSGSTAVKGFQCSMDEPCIGGFINNGKIVRSLETWLEEDMPEHILWVCCNCYCQLPQIRIVSRNHCPSVPIFVWYSSVQNRLDYCNSVLYSLTESQSRLCSLCWMLQLNVNSRNETVDHITPVSIDLHWLPYHQHVTYNIHILMFKFLRGHAIKIAPVSGPSELSSAQIWLCLAT